MAQTQIEILLKAKDEATKQIQQAFDKAALSVTKFENETQRAGNTLKKAGKEVSGFTSYMREGRQESRQFGFVFRELMDIVGGVALAINLFGDKSKESDEKSKRLTQSVMAAYITFQSVETVVSLAQIGIAAYSSATKVATASTIVLTEAQIAANLAMKRNTIGLIIAGVAALTIGIWSWVASGKSAEEQQEELNKKLADFNNEIDVANHSIAKMEHQMGNLSDTAFTKFLEKEIKAKKATEDLSKATLKLAEEDLATTEEKLLELEAIVVKSTENRKQSELELFNFNKGITGKRIATQEAAARKIEDIIKQLSINIETIENNLELTRGVRGLKGIAREKEELRILAEQKADTVVIDIKDTKKVNDKKIELLKLYFQQYKEGLAAIDLKYADSLTENYKNFQQSLLNEREKLQSHFDSLLLLHLGNAERVKEIESAKSDAIKQFDQNILESLQQSSMTQEENEIKKFDKLLKMYQKDSEMWKQIQAEKQKALDNIKINKVKDNLLVVGQALKTAIGSIDEMEQNRFDTNIQRIETEKADKLESIDAQLENEFLSEEERNALLEKRKEAESGYNAQLRVEKARAYEADKTARMRQAIMEGALSMIEASPDYFKMALVAGLTALQLGIIKSQPTPSFHTGGSMLVDAPANKEGFLPIKVRGQERVSVSTGGESRIVNINFNSPVSDSQFITNSIKKVLHQSGLPIEKVFVNNRNVLSL